MNTERGTLYRVIAMIVPVVLLATIPLVAFPGGITFAFDKAFTAWVHSLQTPWLTAAMKWVSTIAYHNVQFWLIGIAGAYFLVRRMQVRPTLALVAARYGSVWLGDVLKDYFARPRPQLAWLAKQSSGYSYPSGSVTIGATFYVMLAYVIASEFEDRRIRFAVQLSGWLFAATICFSRVYLGAHWLSDTVAGLCVAAALTAALAWLVVVPLPEWRVFRSIAEAAPSEMRKRK